MLNIVCWQTTLTEHQVHVMRALSERPEVTLKIVVGKEILNERKEQGWNVPYMADLNILYLEHAIWWRLGRRIIGSNNDSIHLFNTLWGDRRYILLIIYALLKKARVALITEPYSDTVDDYYKDKSGVSGFLRKILRPTMYRAAGCVFGQRISPVLAISPKAVQQFRKAGFIGTNIFPFGYFIPSDASAPEDKHPNDDMLKLIYIGSFIRRKGVDTAIAAVEKCVERGIRVTLDLYGHGEYARYRTNENPSIKHCGVIPFGESQKILREYDLLILPSRYDGWGVVVNEAIQQGIPALVSRNAGASAIVESSGAGAVFDPNDVDGLVNIIDSVDRDRSLLVAWKKSSLSYRDRLSPENAANYICQCLSYAMNGAPRPVCPWYE